MKQGGVFLAIILAISGVLHFTGSGVSPQTSSGASAAKGKNPHPHSKYIDDLRGTIQEFYGVWEKDSTKADNLAAYWNVPDSEELTGTAQKATPHPRDDVHFAIAILPDPLHTRLALVFDRSIEAIQEAAERKGYSFDRAVFPWDRTPPPQPDDIEKRREAAEVQKAAEEFPGLLIFRGPNRDASGGAVEYPAPLFVFVVGETPTSGVRKKQFQNTLEIMSKIREGNHSEPVGEDRPANLRPLLILGPNSSGSLRSLKRELKLFEAKAPGTEAFVYSGSVTDAASMFDFTNPVDPAIHFASFQDNDDFIRDRFVQFACHDGYSPSQIATLSEGDTAYGSGVQNADTASAQKASDANANAKNATKDQTSKPASAPPSDSECPSSDQQKTSFSDPQQPQSQVVHLRFPREISYFRAAYQDKTASQPASGADIPVPQSAAVALNPEEIGTDDDAALPYAGAQTPATQEAVMLGIISELNKHHTKFTILYASDPLDQYFLARYLRTKYPRGRVVVTTPDLLLTSQEDSSLRGVISINTYPIVAGLSDMFCSFSDPLESGHRHDDRLFVSSSSIGTFNAMLGLLSQSEIADASLRVDRAQKSRASKSDADKNSADVSSEHQPARASVPVAPYAEYATPQLRTIRDSDAQCVGRPLVWLTILGQDGFWPIAGLSNDDFQAANRNVPILAFRSMRGGSTEPDVVSAPGETNALTVPQNETPLRLPPAWKIAYYSALFMLLIHLYLSLNGSVLADSEPRAQFGRIGDWRDVTVIALGALALATVFVTIVFSGGPVVAKSLAGNLLFWLPFFVFVLVSFYDLARLREHKAVAWTFVAAIAVMLGFELLAWINAKDFAGCWAARATNSTPFACKLVSPLSAVHTAYWSTRLFHYASGVSPVLPILFLGAAGYWWMWQSLRGVTLVDRRRPRLPNHDDPAGRWYRINDREAAELRNTAHPFYFKWSVLLIVVAVGIILANILELAHPVQTIEGYAYDVTYTVLLGFMVATLIGCLLKLIFTWLKCSQILSGLDRLPLRDAFGRMKHLSWNSFWSPGGSTLRATYKVLRRGIDCLERLSDALQSNDPNAPIKPADRASVQTAISKTMRVLGFVSVRYVKVVDPKGNAAAQDALKNTALARLARFFRGQANSASSSPSPLGSIAKARKNICGRIADTMEKRTRESANLKAVMDAFQVLQMRMASTAAIIVDEMLDPWWKCDKATVVSEDERIDKTKLPLTRALAEEFAALVYVNFLITVLLRMRTLVMTSIGMYVFIVLSMNVYPFEPHAALQTLAVVLLVVMGAAVAFVYAQMHRDPILSRLTSTASGELGFDFWLKLASAGAIPVFSLLAVQFPAINQFLFSWLEPALQAVK